MSDLDTSPLPHTPIPVKAVEVADDRVDENVGDYYYPPFSGCHGPLAGAIVCALLTGVGVLLTDVSITLVTCVLLASLLFAIRHYILSGQWAAFIFPVLALWVMVIHGWEFDKNSELRVRTGSVSQVRESLVPDQLPKTPQPERALDVFPGKAVDTVPQLLVEKEVEPVVWVDYQPAP
ncbi:MAG: hypothetical protein NW241_18480 [Bacteroidia bacterium]|nr:hypothetical protein [Bacteroidia bacterium]